MIELKGQYNKDCKIFNDEIEEDAITLIYSLLNVPVFENVPVRIMPDVHLGKSIVIGFTAPITNMICPSHVGVDIGCSISTYIIDAKINPEEYPILEHKIRQKCPLGFNIQEKRIFEMKDFLKFLRIEYNKAKSSWPKMIGERDISEKGISKMLQRIGMDEGIFYKSLGSVGSGNHFLELGECNGHYTFTIHCGSRNFGVKVCKYWERVAKEVKIDRTAFSKALDELKASTVDKTTLPEKIKQLKREYEIGTPQGYLKGEDMKGYLSDMVIATAYAAYNHELLAHIIADIFRKINGGKVVDKIKSVHNYVDFQDHMIRKGAIRSYEYERMVVPFNMKDGLAICVGKSNEDWNYSCSHGAGRKLSRSAAKKELSLDEFTEAMKDVYSTSVCRGTLDEAPGAYKDTETILDLIQDTCEVLYMIKPVVNMKATETVEED